MHAAPTQNGSPFKYSEAARKEVLEIVTKYPEGRGKSAILRALHLAQEENHGWLSVSAMDEVAATLTISPI